MTVVIAWQSWLYDSPTAWQLDCTDRLISLTEWLPWQMPWLPWQLGCHDSLLPWQIYSLLPWPWQLKYLPVQFDYHKCLNAMTAWQYHMHDCRTVPNVWLSWLYDSLDCMTVWASWQSWLYDSPTTLLHGSLDCMIDDILDCMPYRLWL